MRNRATEKIIHLNQVNKNQTILPKKNGTKAKNELLNAHIMNKKDLKKDNYDVIIENAKTKLNNILDDENIPDDYKKNFIDIDIKLTEQSKQQENEKKKKLNDSKTNKNQKSEINILNYINNLTNIFSDCNNKFKFYKEQFDNLIPNELKEKPCINYESFEKFVKNKINRNNDLESVSKISTKNNIGKNTKDNKENELININKYAIELNELKAEIYLFKMRYEIYKAKSLFYENIFNTVKNTIDNFFFKINSNKDNNSIDSNLDFNYNKAFGIYNKDNLNKKSDNNDICHTLKEKLNLILTQNNKYYYQEFQEKFKTFEYRNYNFCNKDWDFDSDQKLKVHENEKYLKNLDKSISEIAQIINNFLKDDISKFNIQTNNLINISQNESNIYYNQISNTLNTLKNKLFSCLKSLISVYLTGENLNFDIRAKNQFILEMENEYVLFEQKERKNKIMKELTSLIQPNLNKVINNKFKNEIVDKFSSIINFYENFNIILKNENAFLKNQLGQINQIKDYKINTTEKIVDQFLIYSEPTFIKLRELTDLSTSVNLKNKEKLILAFMNVEFNNFYDIIDKYYELKNKYNSIR